MGGSSCTSGTLVKSLSFDSIGNILTKSDVGTYTYGGSGAGPHAVSSIATSTGCTLGAGCFVNGQTNPGYTYDLNGNMTAGAGRSVTYTAFNMAAQITQGANTTNFTYDSEHQRIVQTASGTTTTYLNDAASGASSEKVTSGSTSTYHDYVLADGQIVTERATQGSTVTLNYITGDHLGSASVVTNASAAIVERDSYDAWGKRRNPNGTDNAACSITSAVTRGFTGQEMMDALCEINLNARIYDPQIARFQAADSVVPDPMDGQSFNRYSYVNNGPLSFVDPSGHEGLPPDTGDSGNGSGVSNTQPPDQKKIQPEHYGPQDIGPPCFGCYGPGTVNDDSGDWQTTDERTGIKKEFTSAKALFDYLDGLLNKGVAVKYEFNTLNLQGSVTFGPGVGVEEDGKTSWSSVLTSNTLIGISAVDGIYARPNPIYGTKYSGLRLINMGPFTGYYGIYRQGTLRGEVISLTYHGNATDIQWIQIFTATGPGDTGNPTLDDKYSSNPPYYNSGGPNFLDTPGRSTDATWQAHLSLVQTRQGGGYSTLYTIQYGFSTLGNTVTLMPVTIGGR